MLLLLMVLLLLLLPPKRRRLSVAPAQLRGERRGQRRSGEGRSGGGGGGSSIVSSDIIRSCWLLSGCRYCRQGCDAVVHGENRPETGEGWRGTWGTAASFRTSACVTPDAYPYSSSHPCKRLLSIANLSRAFRLKSE